MREAIQRSLKVRSFKLEQDVKVSEQLLIPEAMEDSPRAGQRILESFQLKVNLQNNYKVTNKINNTAKTSNIAQ